MAEPPQQVDESHWRARFHAPAVLWTQIAANRPARGIAASNQSGATQVYAWDVPSGRLTQLTHRPYGLLDACVSGDGEHIYFLADRDGNEVGHLHRLSLESGAVENLTPELPEFSSWWFETDAAGERVGFTASYSGAFHVYERSIGTSREPGALKKIYQSSKFAYGPLYSFDGRVALVTSTERGRGREFSVVAIDTGTGEKVGELWDGPGTSVEPVRFRRAPGDWRVAATTTRGGYKRPLLWDARTGERLDLELPQLSGDVLPVDWSRDGCSLLLAQVSDARHQLHLLRLRDVELRRLEHPSGTFNFPGTYFSAQGTIYAQWQSSNLPSRLIELDATSGAMLRTVLAGRDTPPSRPWRSVSFPSSDDQEIQAWLALPAGEGPFPTIVHSHGGPETVMTEIYAPVSQAWLDHGFAYLTVNYRGSTTFGKEFQGRIWGNIGHWETEDLVAAREWLVNAGIARTDGVFLNGWSYGGFLALLALGRHPQLWAGAMAGIAVADWTSMYEDASTVMKGYLAGIFGGTPEEHAQRYRQSSPVTYAQHVQAPILVIQGEHDTRTPARQMRDYEETLRALGKQIEVVWYPAGHLGAGTDTTIQHFAKMRDFAQRILTGVEEPPLKAKSVSSRRISKRLLRSTTCRHRY